MLERLKSQRRGSTLDCLELSQVLSSLFQFNNKIDYKFCLSEDTNTFNGVVIKYSEPPEAR